MKEEELNRLIQLELERFRVPEARIRLENCLIAPYGKKLSLENGEGSSLVYVVATLGNDRTIVYSANARKSSDCWGIIEPSQEDVGTDDRWFLTLEDAFFQSGGWSGQLPPDYEVL